MKRLIFQNLLTKHRSRPGATFLCVFHYSTYKWQKMTNYQNIIPTFWTLLEQICGVFLKINKLTFLDT